MARINKKSRLKGLPPKIQLFEKDSVESQGNNDVPWDDTKSLVFSQQQDINYGSKLDGTSRFLTSELSSSISTIGKTISGISDTWTIQQGTSSRISGGLVPYRDSDNPAVDGLSSGNSFFTSSPVEGFTQPLWSKTKFEIDISSKPCSFKMTISQSRFIDTVEGSAPYYDNGTPSGYLSGSSYPMAYYNFTNQMWEGIGTGYPLQSNNITTSSIAGDTYEKQNVAWLDALEYATIGFNPGILNLKAQITNALTSSTPQQVDYARHFLSLDPPRKDIVSQKQAGQVTDNYGFPYAAKFHATGSQLLNMSDYISKPFLLEKIVVEISGAQFTMFDSVTTGGHYSLTSSVLPASINNFFILNQRLNSKYSLRPARWGNEVGNSLKIEIPKLQRLTSNSELSPIDSVRDLVTYGGITAYTRDIDDRPTETIPFLTDPVAVSNKASSLNSQVSGAQENCPLYGVYFADNVTTPMTASSNILTNITRDFQIFVSSSISSSLSAMSWTSNIKANIPVRSPNKTFFFDSNSMLAKGDTSNTTSLWNVFGEGGTSGLGFANLCNRRPKSDLGNVSTISNTADLNLSALYTVKYAIDFTKANASSLESMFVDNKPSTTENPYLLFPSDQLVFGWQLPTPQYISDYISYLAPSVSRLHHNVWGAMSVPPTPTKLNGLMDICQMTFGGPGKITFYGSYISQGLEDTEQSSVVVVTSAISKPIGEQQ